MVNKWRCIDWNSTNKNVFFQKPPYPDQQEKLKWKKPDYILYQSGTKRPIAIIEAKKWWVWLENALLQGTEYAKALNVPLVFAMNWAYCETRFVPNDKELVLNWEEVRELIREREALEFLNANTNEARTIPQEVKVSRDELITQFKNLNDVLRWEWLRAWIERFSEFANILFLKLMSENSESSRREEIKNQSNEHVIPYINTYVIKQIQDKYWWDVFTPIQIKNPQTLRHIIEALDPLILSTIDTDVKGDAFEYFLEKTTSTENDLGEYFTPRNIIKTVVNLVNPKFKESVYDPFCWTWWFLTESFNYIKENAIIQGEKEKRILKYETLYGREITTTARIAKMNMVLHWDWHSWIQQTNTLTNPDFIEKKIVDEKEIKQIKKFDVVVTNMPFSQTITTKTTKNWKTKIENNISPMYYNWIAKNNWDSVCVLHCLRSLKKWGRMALVVPEWFLFRKDVANVREFLLSKAELQSVISLPQWTFLPYTWVKTDILYFTNAHEKNDQKNFRFFNVKNVGVSLDNHKRKLKGSNDLKKIESSDIKRVSKNPDLKESMLSIWFKVIDINDVKKNDYNLVWNFYVQNTELDLPSSPLEELATLFVDGDWIESKNQSESWIRLIQTGNIWQWQYLNKKKKARYISEKTFEELGCTEVLEWDVLVSRLPEPVWRSCIIPDLWTKMITAVDCTIIRFDTTLILPDYFMIFSLSDIYKSQITKYLTWSSRKRISRKNLGKVRIPLLPLERQIEIIKQYKEKQQRITLKKEEILEIEDVVKSEINSIW